MKIAVYAIAKDEARFVRRFCDSAGEADLILIGDTGSADDTYKLAIDCGARVYDIHVSPWRFDLARNAVLALLPRDVDVCVSLDLDEVLEPGWRDEIERVWKPGETTRLRYCFDWGGGIRFFYEKIHARHGYRWHHPCHEYPVPDARIGEVYAHTDKLLVRHLPDPSKSRGQYLELLRLAVTEDPRCPRNAFYFARELTFHRRWEDAVAALTKYLAMPEANWPNERCYAMRLMGQCWDELAGLEEAMRWYRRACAEAPKAREPWCDLALACYRREQWAECYAAATTALAITDRALVYTCDPKVWGALPHDLASIAAWHLGLIDESVRQVKAAVAIAPEDERLRRNLASIEAGRRESA